MPDAGAGLAILDAIAEQGRIAVLLAGRIRDRRGDAKRSVLALLGSPGWAEQRLLERELALELGERDSLLVAEELIGPGAGLDGIEPVLEVEGDVVVDLDRDREAMLADVVDREHGGRPDRDLREAAADGELGIISAAVRAARVPVA